MKSAFPFLYVRDWVTGRRTLSRTRLLVFLCLLFALALMSAKFFLNGALVMYGV